MSLMKLPNELIFQIVEQSGCILSVSGLIWTNTRLYNLLIGDFYTHVVDYHPAYGKLTGYNGFYALHSLSAYLVWATSNRYQPAMNETSLRILEATLNGDAVLNPKFCATLNDLADQHNPIREMLIRGHSSCVDWMWNFWLHPDCLLPVQIGCFERVHVPSNDYQKATRGAIALYLLRHEVDVRFTANDLYEAIGDEDLPLMNLLLDRGVAFENECPGGSTWFSEAIRTMNAKAVKLLFDYGLQPTSRDKALATRREMESPEIYRAFQDWKKKQKEAVKRIAMA